MGYQKQPMAICDVTQGGIWGCCLGGKKCQKNMGGGRAGQGSTFLGEISAQPGISIGGRMDTGTPWQRSRWVWAPLGLHFSFILVWIKGALHLLGSQEKHASPCPVGLFALDPARTPKPMPASAKGYSDSLSSSHLHSPSQSLLPFANKIQAYFLKM